MGSRLPCPSRGVVRAKAAAQHSSIGRRQQILNPYLSSGTKDAGAASLVIEPLAEYNPGPDA